MSNKIHDVHEAFPTLITFVFFPFLCVSLMPSKPVLAFSKVSKIRPQENVPASEDSVEYHLL